MRVNIHNDGKEKYQSYECWIGGIDCARGYGATEQQAVEDYENNLMQYFVEINKAVRLIGNTAIGTNNTVKVDYKGDEIK